MTPEQLAARFTEADHRGARDSRRSHEPRARPVAVLATAIPPAATLNVAIHTLHPLPQASTTSAAEDRVFNELPETAAKNAADNLHRAHLPLELDGTAHAYKADQWLPTICDITAQLFDSAKLQSEPPALVQAAQDAVTRLSPAVAEPDEDSAETANTPAEALARRPALWVFATEPPAR